MAVVTVKQLLPTGETRDVRVNTRYVQSYWRQNSHFSWAENAPCVVLRIHGDWSIECTPEAEAILDEAMLTK